jgi:hypothetical protein
MESERHNPEYVPDTAEGSPVENFDWRMEEEEALWEPEATRVRPRPRRRAWMIALVALALVLTAVISYRRLVQRVDQAGAAVRDDVLAVFDLMWQAAGRGDAELYESLLQASHPRMSQGRQQLIEAGLLFDRSPLGLTRLGDRPRIVSVSLAPDLTTAEVRWQQDYAIHVALGSTETVTLEYTAVYRLDDGRWLQIEPDIDYWGEWQTFNGRSVTVSSPARENGIAARLATELDELVGLFCADASPLLACPNQRPLRLRLEVLPTSLQSMHDTQQVFPFLIGTAQNSGSPYDLPTPTLVGLPVDEAGYQALYRGYARRLLSLMVQSGPGRSTSPTVLDWARLEQQVVAAGLWPWPPLAPTKQTTIGYRLAFTCATPEGGDLYEYDPTTAGWQRRLANLPLTAVASLSGYDGLVLQTQMERPAASQSRSTALTRAPLILQTQTDGSGTLITGAFATVNHPITLAIQAEPAEPIVQWWLYRREEILFLHEWQPPFPGASAWVSIQNAAAPKLLFALREERLGSDASYYLADLDRCAAGECRLQRVPGWPLWSPDGRHALFSQSASTRGELQLQLYLADSDGHVIAELGDGQSPFWLDNERYGFTRISPNPVDTTLSLGSLREGEAPVTLHFTDLLTLHGGGEVMDGEQLYALSAAVSGRREILLSAYTYNPTAARPPIERRYTYWLRFAGDGLAVESAKVIDSGVRHRSESMVSLSANGRWLTRLFQDPTSGLWAVQFMDWEEERRWQFDLGPIYPMQASFSYYSLWSPDGRWLLVSNSYLFYLLDPENQQHHAIIPERPGCLWPAWLE